MGKGCCSLLSVVKFIRLWLDYFIDFIFHLYYRNSKQIVPPIKNPILLESATSLATKIRTKVITSEEVVQAHIDRIKEVNPLINALVDNRFEEALDEARKIDDDIKNGKISDEEFKKKYLLGVPFTSKESIVCKGLISTFGLVQRTAAVQKEDADCVKYMKTTGAILLGVSNVPQLALWFETFNPVYGYTNNPFDTTRTVGGSSGGEGSLIASCGSPLGIGSDIGGSVRIPSSMCGLFGHKITGGIIPTKGMIFKTGEESETTMDVIGPLARHPEDLIPGVKGMLGPNHLQLKLDQSVDVSKLKIYYMFENNDWHCSTVRPEVKDAVKRAVGLLSETGEAVELHLEEFASSYKIFFNNLAKEKNFDLLYDLTNRERKANRYSELFKYIFGISKDLDLYMILWLFGMFVPSIDETSAMEAEKELKRKLIDALGEDGVLIFPSLPIPAQHHLTNYFRIYNYLYTSIFNALKFPVTQVPMGLNHEGVPVGVQIVAAPKMDRLCIAVAKEIASKNGGFVPPFTLLK